MTAPERHWRYARTAGVARTARAGAVAGLLAVGLTLAGCASTSTIGSTPTSSAPGTSSTTSLPNPSTTLPAGASGLRGFETASATCPTTPGGAAGGVVSSELTAVSGLVVQFVICPQMIVSSTVRPSVVIAASDAVHFGALVQALSAADLPSQPGQACPMYADLPQVVFARSAPRIWLLHLPVDSCHHYQAAVLAAIRAADPSQPSM